MSPTAQLKFEPDLPSSRIMPLLELGAYEALWNQEGASFKTIADRFRGRPGSVPSDFVSEDIARDYATRAFHLLRSGGINRFGVRIHGAGEYPAKLRDALHPIELLYFQGWWDLVETRCVAVVGTRQPSAEALRKTASIARQLVRDDFTVVSGLARGIDTEAHRTALAEKGRTIAVLGTPLFESYPPENAALQREIAEKFLVISQVPAVRYNRQRPGRNRLFFPERNVTMSALTEATIIVEAGETSGTLTQARAAFHQGRKLLILDSCFRNPSLTWPKRFAERGAIRVTSYRDIRDALGPAPQRD
jgi:DNA processing protein